MPGDGAYHFLDSDDKRLPHNLALAAAFFAAHQGEHLFTSEFWKISALTST